MLGDRVVVMAARPGRILQRPGGAPAPPARSGRRGAGADVAAHSRRAAELRTRPAPSNGGRRRQPVTERLRTAGLVLVPLLAWELLARLGPWPRWLFPDPLAVARSIADMVEDGRLGAAVLRSLSRLARAIAVSVVLGRAAGNRDGAERPASSDALKPVVMGLQALPSICWLPLALLWFGLSDTAILFVVVMGSLLAIAIATEDGVAAVDPLLLRVAGTLGVRGLALLPGRAPPGRAARHPHRPEARLELRLARADGRRAALRLRRARPAPHPGTRAARRRPGDGA